MAAGRKTGGRSAGTQNKATRQVKEFLTRVFGRAFTETVEVYVTDKVTGKQELRKRTLEDLWVEQLLTGQMDEKLLQFLLTMYAGRPTQQVEVAHSGQVTLEQIIAGTVPEDTPEDGS